MSESKKRQSHSAQFKAKVGLEAIQGLKTINELGREHGVHPVQVGQWKREIQERTSSLFEGKRGPKAVDSFADPEQMLKKIGQLEMERDWLKKKLGVSP